MNQKTCENGNKSLIFLFFLGYVICRIYRRDVFVIMADKPVGSCFDNHKDGDERLPIQNSQDEMTSCVITASCRFYENIL